MGFVRRACPAAARERGREVTASRSAARSSGQVGRGQAAADACRVPLEREIDDPEADGGEVVAAGGRHRREEADRREARDRVDLVEHDRVALEQEVDPGEALGPDRPVGVPGELQEERAGSASGTSARGDVCDRPGVYFAW